MRDIFHYIAVNISIHDSVDEMLFTGAFKTLNYCLSSTMWKLLKPKVIFLCVVSHETINNFGCPQTFGRRLLFNQRICYLETLRFYFPVKKLNWCFVIPFREQLQTAVEILLLSSTNPMMSQKWSFSCLAWLYWSILYPFSNAHLSYLLKLWFQLIRIRVSFNILVIP